MVPENMYVCINALGCGGARMCAFGHALHMCARVCGGQKLMSGVVLNQSFSTYIFFKAESLTEPETHQLLWLSN